MVPILFLCDARSLVYIKAAVHVNSNSNHCYRVFCQQPMSLFPVLLQLKMKRNVLNVLVLLPTLSNMDREVHKETVGRHAKSRILQMWYLQRQWQNGDSWVLVIKQKKTTETLSIQLICYNPSLLKEQTKQEQKKKNVKWIRRANLM